METQKRKLIALITIQIIIVVIHRILDQPPENIDEWYLEIGWHYWVTMGFEVYLAFYVLTCKCHSCKKPQICRGVNPSEWYWPKDKCWACGTDQVTKK